MAITQYGSFNYSGTDDLIGTGSDGDDRQSSGSGRDTLIGGAGNDSLFAGPGNDILYGQAGNDSLIGGSDRDEIYGGSGNDTLVGDSIADQGQNAYDYLDGGEGNDEIVGSGSLFGGDGDDDISGFSGQNNRIDGGNGRDILVGNLGHDTLYGGEGDDILNGYGARVTNTAQIDWLYGGAGNDRFILGDGQACFYEETGTGYAVIADWDPPSSPSDQHHDTIQLYRDRHYELNFTRVSGMGSNALDTEIYVLTPGGRDRIAIVQDSTDVDILRDCQLI